ncbi:MAG: hypothetical protein H6Q19_1917, partial [Bacteroidetes bacterium]|nr:hypothetical protein [Bacteroidota bacterium]
KLICNHKIVKQNYFLKSLRKHTKKEDVVIGHPLFYYVIFSIVPGVDQNPL